MGYSGDANSELDELFVFCRASQDTLLGVPVNTITTSPVAPLLHRLFAEADAFDPANTPSVADNADFCPAYLERIRAAGSGYLSVPFAADMELSIRLNGESS